MPTFELDLDIDEIVDELTSSERQRLAQKLYDYGYIPKEMWNVTDTNHDLGIKYDEFNEALDKIKSGRLQLTIEDENRILEIARKV
jgi:hypothetical protein